MTTVTSPAMVPCCAHPNNDDHMAVTESTPPPAAVMRDIHTSTNTGSSHSRGPAACTPYDDSDLAAAAPNRACPNNDSDSDEEDNGAATAPKPSRFCLEKHDRRLAATSEPTRSPVATSRWISKGPHVVLTVVIGSDVSQGLPFPDRAVDGVSEVVHHDPSSTNLPRAGLRDLCDAFRLLQLDWKGWDGRVLLLPPSPSTRAARALRYSRTFADEVMSSIHPTASSPVHAKGP
ncbi:hypothetical protein EDB83DRAFT_2521392 [Lactarius deliciosus]|nr:hypothetical protein EDB83DRAFT_2521392 [Lactarius deliciosus]